MQFTPLHDFFSKELRSQYCVGLSYKARPEDELLLALLPDWIKEGKVKLGAPSAATAGLSASAAKVSGVGEVQTVGPGDVGTLKL